MAGWTSHSYQISAVFLIILWMTLLFWKLQVPIPFLTSWWHIYLIVSFSLWTCHECVCVCGGEGGGGGAGPCKDKIQFYFLLSICLRSVSFLVRPARRTERDRRKNFALLTAHYLIFLSLNFSFSKMVSLTTSKISWTTRGNRYKAPDQ